MTRQPRRWVDGDAPPEVQRMLASAASDRPDRAQLANLRGKLESTLGPGFSARPEPAKTAVPQAAAMQGAAGSSLSTTLAITAAVALGLGAAWYGMRARPEPARDIEPARAPIAAPLLPPSAAAEPTREPAASEPAAPAPAAIAPPAPEPAKATGPRVARSQARPASLAEELKQLETIRRLLEREPARALAATSRHAQRFPQGALGPERELLRLEAFLRLGRRAEAEQLADRALAQASPYRKQIQQLVAEAR